MRPLVSCLAASLAAVLSAGALAEVHAFSMLNLSGEQEVPPSKSSGQGWLTATYDTTSRILTYSYNWTLSAGSTATMAHFHGPAVAGVSAPVVIDVQLGNLSNAGSAGGSVTLTAAQEADLLAGKWYFNLHSTSFPGGELRAQMIANTGQHGNSFAVNSGRAVLPNVGIPGFGVYDVEMQLSSVSPTITFTLIKADKRP
ncbi:CHRD domain-containing protein [Chitinimonas lacunae]|uniref:CHRD domain-containing protein n=1 Tax=Chitinimonas lacunae TaxID=1963018 RepID=A0ABV8MWA8_9NEIS